MTGKGFKYKDSAYKWVCRTALQNVASDLQNATVVIDGSGERKFRRELRSYLRQQLNRKRQHHISGVKLSPSCDDPLIQLADYVASITNRLYGGKSGEEVYEGYLRRKRRSQRKWP